MTRRMLILGLLGLLGSNVLPAQTSQPASLPATQPTTPPATQPADSDLAVLRDETELNGNFRLEAVRLRSPLGEFDLPAEKLRALRVDPGRDGAVTLTLDDGQVLRGAWLGEPLRIELPGGQVVPLPWSRLASARFGEGPAETQPEPLDKPHVQLRDGHRLIVRPENVPAEFRTRFGPIAPKPDDLARIHFTNDDPQAEGTLHRLVLRNGSTLTGLLNATELNLALELGPTVTLPRGELAGLVLHPVDRKPEPGQWTLTLPNGDRLVGTIRTGRLALLGELGEVALSLENLRQVAPLDDGRFEVAQARGPTLRGVLLGEPVVIELPGGEQLPVPPADIRTLVPTSPAEPTAAGERPETGSTSRPSHIAKPSNDAERKANRSQLDENLRRLDLEIEEYEKVIQNIDAQSARLAEMRARGGNLPAEVEQKLQEHRQRLADKIDAARKRQADLRKQRADLDRPAPVPAPPREPAG